MPSPALIFDLDGTLVDTAPDLLAATNAVMAARGLSLIHPATLRHMVGFGARSLIERAMEAVGQTLTPDDLPPPPTDRQVRRGSPLVKPRHGVPGISPTFAPRERDQTHQRPTAPRASAASAATSTIRSPAGARPSRGQQARRSPHRSPGAVRRQPRHRLATRKKALRQTTPRHGSRFSDGPASW